MASIERRTRDGRLTWQARWRDPDGRQRKRSFPRRTDAERFLTTVESSKLAGNYIAPDAGRATLGDFAEKWLAGRVHLKPKTVTSYESLLRSRLLPTWRDVPLSRITYEDAVAWVAEMRAAGLSASRTRQSYHLLTGMLDDAVKGGRLPRNPAAGVDLPKLPTVDRLYLTHAQVAVLAEACGVDRLVVLVLAYTGIRWGEMAALRVRRVDPLRGRLEIAEAIAEIGGRVEWGTTKNHQRRSVPIPRFLRDELRAACAGKAPDDLVFTSPRDGVLHGRNFRRRRFDEAAREIGLEGLVPHELRHTAVSLAVSAGANVKSVQRMLGHKSAAMTLDTYADLFDDDLDAVADRMDTARDAAVPKMCPDAVLVDLAEQRAGR